MSKRMRTTGPIKRQGIKAFRPKDVERWVRVDVTDGTWEKYDPDTSATSITNTAGLNSCNLEAENNSKVTDGCVWYKEVLRPDGSSMSHDTEPVFFRGYVHLPSVGWMTSNGSSFGAVNRPAVATKAYCVLGLMSDPEELPTPRDILGVGIGMGATGYRTERFHVYNTSTSSPNGSITVNRNSMPSITEAYVAADHRSVNRLPFFFSINRNEKSSDSGINIPNNPVSRWMFWRGRFDNGDAVHSSMQSYVTNQKWGRTRTSKLYVWVSVGRRGSVSSVQPMDFDCYYLISKPDTGVNPSGTVGLS